MSLQSAISSPYKAYPQYKDSGVEWLSEIPSSWGVVPIKHLADLTPKKPKKTKVLLSEECSFIPMEKLKLDELELDETKLISEVFDGYTYFENDDVLIAKVTPCFENKNMAVASNLRNGIGFGSSEIYVLRTDKKAHNRYLFYRLQESVFMSIAISNMTGAGGLRRVPSDTINNYSIAIPAKSEQKKIANFLDHETAKIDTLIEKQQRLIELLTEKRQAVISHAVTKGLNPDVPMKDSGVEWLGEVPEHWEVSKIKYIAELTPSKSEVLPHLDEKCSFVPMEKLKRDSLTLDETRIVKDVHQGYTYFKDNDILLAKVTPCFENQNIAVAKHLINGIGFGSSEIFVLRIRNVELNYFMFYRLQENIFMQMGVGAMTGAGGLQRVPTDFINNFQFALPPLKEAQQIVNYLRDQNKRFDILISKANQQIQLMQERRTALISAAVTGKIDVRDWVKPE